MLAESTPADDYLRTLWERVRVAGELIQELRVAKKSLGERVVDLEKELLTVKSEIQQREQELKRIRAERDQLLSAGGNMGFTEDERTKLKVKIHGLISKINSHL